MKKIKLISLLFIGCLALGLSACNVSGDKTSETGGGISISKDNIANFTDKSVSVEIGSRYTPDYTEFTDNNGKTYVMNEDLMIYVMNHKGEETPSTNGSFAVKDFEGYIVQYRIFEGAEYIERKVNVSVTDETAPEITIVNWRAEREVGVADMPYVYVYDNSGEALKTNNSVVDATTGQASANAILDEENGKVTFTQPGTYKFIATATDSHGNSAIAEKEIIITESMGANVWENFDNANHLATVKANECVTSHTKAAWLEEFKGEQGVAKITPTMSMYWYQGAYISFGFNKTVEEIEACEWDYITIRLYIESKTSIVNFYTPERLIPYGSCSTNQWVDFVIEARDYLKPTNEVVMFGIKTETDLTTRYNVFAKSVAGENPRPFLMFDGNSDDNRINLYIDEITWGQYGEDVTAPSVTLQGFLPNVMTNEIIKLPTPAVRDDQDPTETYISMKAYKVTDSGDVELKLTNGSFQIEEAGKYKIVVKVKDFSGNEADREFIMQAVDTIDYSIMATYDTESSIGIVTSGTRSWLAEFEGEEGIMKVETDLTDYGGLNVQFPALSIEKAIEAEFDYVRFRIYVEVNNGIKEVPVFSWWDTLAVMPVGKWIDVDITMKELSNCSSLSYQNQLTRVATYSQFVNAYVNQSSVFFEGLSDRVNGAHVTYYFDEITWGCYADKNIIQEVPGLQEIYYKGETLQVPTLVNVDDGITLVSKQVSEFKVYYLDNDIREEVVPTDNTFVFKKAGNYLCVVKAERCPDAVFEFSYVDEELSFLEGILVDANTQWFGSTNFTQKEDGEYEWYANNNGEGQYTYIQKAGYGLDVVTFKLRSVWEKTPIYNRVKLVYNGQTYSYNDADNSWYGNDGVKNTNIVMLMEDGSEANLKDLTWDDQNYNFPYVTFIITGITTELELHMSWPGNSGYDAYASYNLRDILWTRSSKE